MKTTTLIAVAALAATAMPFLAQEKAFAYCRGCAVGAGVIGGIAAGAIIGGAIANSQANAQASAGAPVYVAPPPPPPPGIEPADLAPGDAYGSAVCHIEKQRVWDDRGGQHWSNVEVCD